MPAFRPHWHINEAGTVIMPDGQIARSRDITPGHILIDYRSPPLIRCADAVYRDWQLLAINVVLKPQSDLLHG
jgi:hypothetical protein